METKFELSSGLQVSIKILELLKKRKDINASCISIGTFTNCRECGYTYMITDGSYDNWFTFCTYEHRNSDDIVINGKTGLVNMNDELPYNGDSKYDFLASFRYDDYEGAVSKLVELINDVVKKATK